MYSWTEFSISYNIRYSQSQYLFKKQGPKTETSANYLKLFRLSIFCDRLSLKSV